MQSRNPVFARAEGFNGRTNAYGNPTYAGAGQPYAGYGTGMSFVGGGTMTLDSVIQKTGITLLVMVLTAGATWVSTGNVMPGVNGDTSGLRSVMALAMIGAAGGFILSLVNSFKKTVSPALVLAYAAFEGLFIGGMSKAFEAQWPGIVTSAVAGTVVASGATLAVYKYAKIRVGDRFRRWVTAAMFGFVAVSLLDFVLYLFHAQIGVNQISGIGFIFSFIGLGLAILMLILDFDYVERGVAAGLPDSESWRAAFGLTVTIVWLYIEILRILAQLRNN